jgi:hypothetical protein
MRCEKCSFACDPEDVFCRKCGSALAHEAAYNEIHENRETVTAEVKTLEVVESTTLAPEKPGRLSRLTSALKSDEAKKLARGAALVAVGVGIELAAQAINKLGQPQNTPTRALAPRFPEVISPSASSDQKPIIIESVTYQRIYTRRIIRRVQ